MTCDERLELELNQAGQTISDLPLAYNLDKDSLKEILDVATQWFVGEDFPHQARVDITTIPLAQYILHLTDIIDRMETALVNVCGERDYLRSVVCGLCSSFRKDGADACETCIVGDGIPEYWRVDDENR